MKSYFHSKPYNSLLGRMSYKCQGYAILDSAENGQISTWTDFNTIIHLFLFLLFFISHFLLLLFCHLLLYFVLLLLIFLLLFSLPLYSWFPSSSPSCTILKLTCSISFNYYNNPKVYFLLLSLLQNTYWDFEG